MVCEAMQSGTTGQRSASGCFDKARRTKWPQGLNPQYIIMSPLQFG